MPATDLRRQFLAEHSELLSFWRANVRREVFTDHWASPHWRKENQLRERAGRQPGETAAIGSATEGEAPVPLKSVPAQVGELELFAAHGLDGISEDRLDMSDFCEHARSESAKRIPRSRERQFGSSSSAINTTGGPPVEISRAWATVDWPPVEAIAA